jgi:hypothetical protein
MPSEQGAGAATTVSTSFAELMARDTAGKMARDVDNTTDSQILNPKVKEERRRKPP